MSFSKRSYAPYHVTKFIRSAFKSIEKKIGIQKAKIFLDWEKIVGKEINKLCSVYKIIYASNKTQLKVYISASSSASLTLHYMKPQIIERINIFLGSKVCEEVIIKKTKAQSHYKNYKKSNKSLSLSLPEHYSPSGIEKISHCNLKNALRSLCFTIEQYERNS